MIHAIKSPCQITENSSNTYFFWVNRLEYTIC